MDPRDLLLLGVRWFHAAAAVVMVGGSAVYLTILTPLLRQQLDDRVWLRSGLEAGFKEIVDLSLVVFVVSGALLTFERLSSGAASTPYVILLGLKVLVSVLLYRWAFQVRRGHGWESRAARLMVGAGFLVLLLAAGLKTLYEAGLRA